MAWKDPLIGRTLNDRYRIVERIGKGGFGVVYKVTHTTLEKAFAMKALFRSSQLNSKLVGRFEREAKATSRIGHPNIVDVVDWGQDEAAGYYFIMEFLEGMTLQQLIEREGALKPIRAVRIGAQVASALLATHQNGIIHRDLKPENIMLLGGVGTQQDFVKVLDFGVAGLALAEGGEDDEEPERLTAAGMVFGTPHYMSPEQALSPNVGHTSDIYSFGVVLYEMVTGQIPFDAPSTMELLTLHRDEAPQRPSHRCPDALIPAGLEQIIMKALAKDPERRWASTAEIIERLESVESSILRGVPIVLAKDADLDSSLFVLPGQTSAAGRPPSAPVPAEAAKPKPLWPYAAVALLIGMAVMAAVLFAKKPARGDPEPPPVATAPAPAADSAEVPLATPQASSPTLPEAAPQPPVAPATTPPPEPAAAEPAATPEPTPEPAQPPPTETEPETEAGAETEAEVATEAQPEPEPAAPEPWRVRLVSKPDGANVTDDASGEDLGKTPLELELPLGTPRALTLTRRGFRTLKVSLNPDEMAQAGESEHAVKMRRRGKSNDPFSRF